jgi:L-ascorbate metabolism protein UlaG (beta-lactamase superfamily)
MTAPGQRGRPLLAEIDRAPASSPVLWWLGHCGFVIKHHRTILYIDPYLSNSQAERYRHSDHPRDRLIPTPLDPRSIRHADLVLCTHAHGAHLDWGTVSYMMEASPQARLVLPKSAIGRANALGVDYLRMIGTDADLRVDYAKDGDACQIVSVASAHEALDYSAEGGFPYLGYVIRFGEHVIYHAGDCVPYDGLIERLKPWGITAALLPINGRGPARGIPGNFTLEEAADLAGAIGARWLVPMHYGMFADNDADINRFIDHMLGFRPAQRFKVFECGEGWELPAE